MFVGKARSLPKKGALEGAHLGRLHPFLQTIDQAGKASKGKHSRLSRTLVNYDHQSSKQWLLV